MKKISRRNFLLTSFASFAGLTFMGRTPFTSKNITVDKVKLGNTGMKVSRIAWGTGTIINRSLQTGDRHRLY